MIDRPRYQLRPELELSFANTWITGDDLVARALGSSGSVDVSVDHISSAEFRFEPELQVPLNGGEADPYRNTFEFAPSAFCRREDGFSTTNDCGIGAEVAIQSRSKSDATTFEGRLGIDSIRGQSRMGLTLSFEHRF